MTNPVAITSEREKQEARATQEGFTTMSRYKAPSPGEIGIVVLFLVIWLFPVIASWGVAAIGLRFSYVSPIWQNQNVDIVGICILIALASGISSAVVGLIFFRKILDPMRPIIWMGPLNGIQRFFLVAITLVAALGLFKSFGGTIFEKSYGGPSIIWLGYGAWSITFLLSLGLLLGDFISGRPSRPGIVFVKIIGLQLIFMPFLLSGSRIDFLSMMFALAAYMLILGDAKFKVRVLMSLAIVVYMAGVASLTGKARYGMHDPSLAFQATVPEKNDDGLLYLSTLGDLGASVFQVVGLVQDQIQPNIGITPALLSYSARLLPGPFFKNRPPDLWTQLPEPIGGGALHPLGEGYLISGLGGCAVVGSVFGMLIAVSVLAGNHFRSTKVPLSWIIFAFPWLLLIRGGWYQFFALFKSLEILILLVLLLMAVRWAGTKYASMNGKGYLCR